MRMSADLSLALVLCAGVEFLCSFAARATVAADRTCVRKWSQACPDGWLSVALASLGEVLAFLCVTVCAGWTVQAKACLAPLAYAGWRHLMKSSGFAVSSCTAGPCGAVQSLVTSTTADKHRFAIACKAPWPCEDHCAAGHNYDVCPEGYLLLETE